MVRFFWDHLNIKPKFLSERLCSIEEALARQEKLFALKANPKNPERWNFLLFAEHEPVFTCKPREKRRIESGDAAGLLKSRINELPAPLFAADENRGGSITYRGPGQLTCYAIVCFEEIGIRGVAEFRDMLLNAVKAVLLHFRVKGYTLPELRETGKPALLEKLIAQGALMYRDVEQNKGDKVKRLAIQPAASGVWVITKEGDPKKICQYGIKVKKNRISGTDKMRHITKYGIALNVTTDLSFFEYIYPCGLDIQMTSLRELLGNNSPELTNGTPLYAIAGMLAKILTAMFSKAHSGA